ncbi:DNA topoisomerase IV subunit B, partial [Candidatus Peregrinibacteria bacterium CG_4_10_14_0_2_um_filter_41_8]
MAKTNNNSNQDYSAKNIQVLEGLAAVRKRPGMYIGTTDIAGLHHLIWEIVDNSIDEAMAGHCNQIDLTIHSDGSLSVEDNGRGIPVDNVEKTGKTALETVLTVLHAGGKFGEGGGYKVSGGLHGVGVSVVNALSSKLVAQVYLNGNIYQQEYCQGDPVTSLEILGTTKKNGTKITFTPDKEIFEITDFDYKTVLMRIRQQAYLTKGIQISIFDERTGQKNRFYFEGGLRSYVQHLNKTRESLTDIFYIEKEVKEGVVEIAFQYTGDFQEHLFSFANNINTHEGGMHLTGFKSALTRTINNYARESEFLKDKDDNLSAEDVREGLTAIISVKLPDPQFEGQTKAKLGNAEMRSAVETVFAESLSEFLGENPDTAKA